MPDPLFTRPTPPRAALPLLSTEARRLTRYRPPFRFTSFFSPEDTLLCALLTESAAARVAGGLAEQAPLKCVELTAGSGLVGFTVLDRWPRATLFGIDVDASARVVAVENAHRLGLGARARFEHLSLWSRDLPARLAAERPDLLVCNPPYIPEPPGERLALEAGSGADGAEHVRRTIELARDAGVPALVLSWCSLCDPVGVVRDAALAGYRLDELGVVAIADGEYSGSVYDYLTTLPTAFLNDWPETVRAVAPDGSARFTYLLLAGAFSRVGAAAAGEGERAAAGVAELMRRFATNGLAALRDPDVAVPVRCWMLDRWDELALRVELHGPLGDVVSPARTLLGSVRPGRVVP